MAHFGKEILFLPNLLTMMRIVIIPIVLYFIDDTSPIRSLFACALYIVSAVTDFLDGYLARRNEKVSLLGKYLDPLADKILVTAILVWMVELGRIEAWIVILLLSREISITALRGLASVEGLVIAARPLGKDKTILQFLGIAFLIIHYRYPLVFTGIAIDFHQIGLKVIYASLALSLFSAIDYLRFFSRAVSQKNTGESSQQ